MRVIKLAFPCWWVHVPPQPLHLCCSGVFAHIPDFCRIGKSREFLSSPVQLIRKHSSLCRLVGSISRLFSNARREQTLQGKQEFLTPLPDLG